MARRPGFPLLVKAAGGGGGIGMRRVDRAEDLAAVVEATTAMAARAFGDGTVYLERYVPTARHIEVQVFGFGDGRAVHLYERECSVQRRFQKVIEEGPSPAIDDATRAAMTEAAVALVASQNYAGAGTVEFIFDDDTGGFYFLEMNTRIQVEHAVTEMITGLDLVQMQLRLARGDDFSAFGQEQVRATRARHRGPRLCREPGEELHAVARPARPRRLPGACPRCPHRHRLRRGRRNGYASAPIRSSSSWSGWPAPSPKNAVKCPETCTVWSGTREPEKTRTRPNSPDVRGRLRRLHDLGDQRPIGVAGDRVGAAPDGRRRRATGARRATGSRGPRARSARRSRHPG